jgi:hypothetical protein
MDPSCPQRVPIFRSHSLAPLCTASATQGSRHLSVFIPSQKVAKLMMYVYSPVYGCSFDSQKVKRVKEKERKRKKIQKAHRLALVTTRLRGKRLRKPPRGLSSWGDHVSNP